MESNGARRGLLYESSESQESFNAGRSGRQNGRVSAHSSADMSHLQILASQNDRVSSLAGLMSLEQRRRNEITVHRASKISYDKSFDARGSFVHFAQHGVRGFMHGPMGGPGSARNVLNRSSWYDSDRAVNARKCLRSKAFIVISMLCLFLSLFLSDILVLYQMPSNTEQDVALTIVLVVFAIEFFGLTTSEAMYPFSFFFWMDMLATVSMAFDISFMLGPDATQPERLSGYRHSKGSSIVVVRAARAARLAARAGRLSRVLKMLRFLSFFKEEASTDKVKMARVIHSQLEDVLSTRVSFLTIAVAIMLPVFGMFKYPEMDESLSAWTHLLASNAAACFQASHLKHPGDVLSEAQHDLKLELRRFSDFYSKLSYGPFGVCYGKKVGSSFHCQSDVVETALHSGFAVPRRRSSIWEFRMEHLRIEYNLTTPTQFEAMMNMGLTCFIVIVMCCAGLVMSTSISNIALHPLERMLSIVRDRCAQIFKYTSELQEGDADMDDDEDEGEYDDKEQSSEFILLEKAVSKLAAIAHLSTTKNEPEVHEEMNESDIMVLNMMGTQVPNQADAKTRLYMSGRNSVRQTSDDTLITQASPTSDETGNTLTWMTSAIPTEVLGTVSDSSFNTLDLAKDTKITVSAYLVLAAEGSATWVRNNVQESQLYKFISTVESKYLPNHFHNFSHALDVLNAIFRFNRQIEAERFLSEISQFWLMIAAIGHDIGHLGVNNQYLVETGHELALTYNDRSPLENMHCSKLFQVFNEAEANVFAQMEKDLYKELRKGIIDAILHTDVTKHNEMIKELNLLYQMNSEAFDTTHGSIEVLQSQANTQLTLNALLHCADVNNPMKPWELCSRIAHLCIDEFFAQGDLEKAAGIPVQMLNDRDKVNRPNSQIGFIEFMIAPLVEAMISLFPPLDELADHLGANIQRWYEVWVNDFSPPTEAAEKVNARVGKVMVRCKVLMRGEGGAAEEMAYGVPPARRVSWRSH